MKLLLLMLVGGLLFCVSSLAAAENAVWALKKDGLLTRWAEKVDPANPLPEYPRPGLVRPDWKSLNGLWEYAVIGKNDAAPKGYEGNILVPYAIESALSGVKRAVSPEQCLWYKKTFDVAPEWTGKRVLLHFGAVDWECTAWLNDKELGSHRGGYDGFSYDITDALKPGAAQELTLKVWDPVDTGWQPRGKQVLKPEGIFYTSVTGIWQTVWLEPVAPLSLDTVSITPDIDKGEATFKAALRGGDAQGCTLEAEIKGAPAVSAPIGEALLLPVPKARLWSPDDPFLYDVTLRLKQNGRTLDEVSSYFGMRKIALGKDEQGVQRLFLNNRPLFQFGPLDQGWWPDGLYTAATDEALRYDVEVTKNMGFNMARKHVKVEPARWYYHCDKLGLLVWQDMPAGDKFLGKNDPDLQRSEESKKGYYAEFKAVINALRNHPSIVMWVPFNEGWGQFDTAEVTEWVRQQDPTRLVNQASGWVDRQSGDVHDMHDYPGPAMYMTEEKRATVLGEFGGLGLPVKDHLWWVGKDNWGYRTLQDPEVLKKDYARLIRQLCPMIANGLAAAVYTQTTDVETEVNGLLTYDRALVKAGLDWLGKVNREVYGKQAAPAVLMPASDKEPQQWRYTTEAPAGEWFAVNFDDASWKQGPGGFGTEATPGAVVRTVWNTPEIWLRRTFTLPAKPVEPTYLYLHHDDKAKVYLNGKAIITEPEFVRGYILLSMDEEGQSLFKEGLNTVAVQCQQAGGNQYIDLGFSIVTAQK